MLWGTFYGVLFAPRALAFNWLTPRGGLETAFPQKLKWREEPLRPLPRSADLCQSIVFALQTSRSYSSTPLSSQKAKSAARPPTRPPPPPWLPLSEAASPTSQRTALALRFESSPTLVLAGQRSRSANNGVLLPRAISPPILAAPCSCFVSADRIRLRQCCLIIAVSTSPSLLGVSPVVPPSAGSVDLASVLYSA